MSPRLMPRVVRREEKKMRRSPARLPSGNQGSNATSRPAVAIVFSALWSWCSSPLAWAGVLPLPALTLPLPPLPRPKSWLSCRLCQQDGRSRKVVSQLVRFVVDQGAQLRELQRGVPGAVLLLVLGHTRFCTSASSHKY
jgi:hypothetical protein